MFFSKCGQMCCHNLFQGKITVKKQAVEIMDIAVLQQQCSIFTNFHKKQ